MKYLAVLFLYGFITLVVAAVENTLLKIDTRNKSYGKYIHLQSERNRIPGF